MLRSGINGDWYVRMESLTSVILIDDLGLVLSLDTKVQFIKPDFLRMPNMLQRLQQTSLRA